MLGMNQIKKKLYTGIAIGLGVGVVCAGLVLTWSMLTIKSYEKGTNKSYNKDFTKMVVVLNNDLVQGQVITSDMLKEIRVNSSTIPKGSIMSMGSAIGQTAKYNIAANSPIVTNMLTNKIVSTDIREQEMNTVLLPSDLTEGDFIDIRIMFPNGTDYIVLSEKQVNKISSQTMWINLNEAERLLLSSATVDSFLNKGTKLYATRYSDPDAQVKFEEENEKVIKDYLTKVINQELPELANINNANMSKDENNKEPIEGGDVVLENKYTDRIFNLIAKYNSLNSVTKKTIATYQPNSEVISAMNANPNISTLAKEKLSNDVRSNIENSLNQYESSNEDKYSNIVSGAQTAITNQQTLRKETLGIQ